MISPLAIFEFQQCPRMRLLSRIQDGGSEPSRLTIKEAIDRIVKPALSRLLANKLDIEQHVSDADAAYRIMLSEYAGLALPPNEDAKYVQEEIGALIEGIVRAAHRVVLPDFQHAESVTMPEKLPYPLSDGIEIEAGPDVLVEYQGGRCGLFWHTVGANMQPNLWILRHSIVPAVLAFNLDLVEVRYVRRGERRDGIQASNLTRHLQIKKNQTTKRTKQVQLAMWQQPGGIKAFLHGRPDTHLASNFGMDWAPVDPTNPKMSQYKYTKNSMTLTQMISQSELQAWRIQVNEQERQIARRAKAIADCTDPLLKAAMVEAYFVQQRQSDPFCAYTAACDQAIVDLQKSGLFRRRA